MAKNIGLVLCGAGHRDGSDIHEVVIAELVLGRLGADLTFLGPARDAAAVVDHATGQPVDGRRQPRVEAARLARGVLPSISEYDGPSLDGLIVPGGWGAATVLSNYAERGALCEVEPALAALMKALLAARKPMGFSGVAAVLAARVLGPVAGVRLTLGSKGFQAAKHAAQMGADVRPCAVDDVVADPKNRIVTTPAFMLDEARLSQVFQGMDKMVRAVFALARDRRPASPEGAAEAAQAAAPKEAGPKEAGRVAAPVVPAAAPAAPAASDVIVRRRR